MVTDKLRKKEEESVKYNPKRCTMLLSLNYLGLGKIVDDGWDSCIMLM